LDLLGVNRLPDIPWAIIANVGIIALFLCHLMGCMFFYVLIREAMS
jgi:hypothetical protein